MHWEGYTISSVLSGVVLMLLALAAIGARPKDRLASLAGGAAFIAYGVYVAGQTSGFFVFPVEIFFIPVLAIGYLVLLAVANVSGKQKPGDGSCGEARFAARTTDGGVRPPAVPAPPILPGLGQPPTSTGSSGRLS
jgi:hypothetical protein